MYYGHTALDLTKVVLSSKTGAAGAFSYTVQQSLEHNSNAY